MFKDSMIFFIYIMKQSRKLWPGQHCMYFHFYITCPRFLLICCRSHRCITTQILRKIFSSFNVRFHWQLSPNNMIYQATSLNVLLTFLYWQNGIFPSQINIFHVCNIHVMLCKQLVANLYLPLVSVFRSKDHRNFSDMQSTCMYDIMPYLKH